MFINTSNRFTKFYTANKTSLDTLLLIVQLIGYAITLLGLLAILGWALAISQAIAWLNQLVEDSLAKPRLLMPAVDTLDTVDADVKSVPNSDAILAEWQAIAANITPLVETASDSLQALSIRQLKKLASYRKISGYSNLTKKELILALS